MRAADFIDTIGVNAHLDLTDSSYATSDVAAQMAYLGIDTIRDSVGTNVSTYVALGEDGIKFDVVTGANHAVALDLSAEMAKVDSIAPYVISVEGPNEVNTNPVIYDGETGPAAADAFQADLYGAVHADPNLSGADVLPFSLSVGGSVAGYGNVSAYADEGNVHGYASDGVPPYYMLGYAVASITTVTNKPVVMSETGYYTLMDGNSGVTQYVQAVWLMDSLLENAASGVAMTYIYQLEDAYDGNPTDPEENYGLFNVDGTAKEAAVDLHNLTTILADNGPDATTFTPGTLAYSVTGLPQYGAFQEVFAKSDGSFDIALWSEPQFFNAQTEATASVPLVAVTVSFSGDYDITVFDPVKGTSVVESRQDASAITVALGTDPLIVSVQSAGAQVNQTGGGGTATIISSGGTATIISSGGSELLSAGDASAGDVVSGGGTLVLAGDTISNGEQVSAYLVFVPSETGGIQVQSGGEIDTAGAVVVDGGSISAGFGGVLSGSVLSSGGLATISSGGIALNTVVSSGGFEFVLSGGTAIGTTVKGGGVLLLLPGAINSDTVDQGGLVISNGALVVSGDPTVAANAYSLSGTAIGAGEEEIVLSYGSVSATTIGDGGKLTVYGGGLARVAEIASGGLATIHSGGTASAITVDAGGLTVIAGGGEVTGTFLHVGGTIDLPDLAAGDGAWARLDSATDVLTVSGAGGLYTQSLDGYYAGEFFSVADDGGGGSLVTLGTQAVDGTPCYCRGTGILTDAGERPVETLRIGDHLVTLAGARRPIRWIGTRSYAGRFVAGRRDVLPVVIRAGALDDGVPRRDLHVSPLHAMFLDGVLVQASALVNGRSIIQPDSVGFVEYFHIELETHDIILAEGAPSETFVDDDSRGMFLNAAEYLTLYPHQPPVPPQYCAPRLEDGPEVERLRLRLADRAARADAAQGIVTGAAESGPGGLQGFLDLADRGLCRGWARDLARPDAPVRLLILDNGVVIADLIADRHRADLAAAGIGNGMFSFAHVIPGGLAPDIDHIIEVRRHGDGRQLGGSPWHLAAQPFAAIALAGAAAAGSGEGHVDLVTRERVVGWARDRSHGDGPVALVILDNGEPVARVLANRYRADVERAGIGDGRHGFEAVFPGGLSPLTRHVVTVRRERDGAAVAASPSIIEPAQGFDPAVAAAVASAVVASMPDGEADGVLSFLLAQRERLLRRRDAQVEAGGTRGRRALVIDACSPLADRDAGSEAVLSHMRALQQLGYAVSFVAAQEIAPPAAALAALAASAITCCATQRHETVEDVLRQGGGFDVVYLHRAEIAARYLALARQSLPRAVILYGVADLHHLRLARQSEVEARPDLTAASRRMRHLECTAAWSADAVITHSTAEADWLRRHVPEARVHVVPWAVPPQPIATPFRARSGIAFIGNYGHAPNVDAAMWLVDEVMELVWRRAPSITCRLVGSAMPEAIRRLAGERVVAVGQVGDLAAEVFERVRLTVAPLRYGAGVKGKVVASLAAGVPCVMSPIAAEGLALPPALQALVGRDAAAMAALICRQHGNRAANAAAAAAGSDFIERGFASEQVADALGAAIAIGRANLAGAPAASPYQGLTG